MRTLDLDQSSRLNFIAKILCTYGWRLTLCGAETRVIVSSVYKMAKALEVQYPEVTLTYSSIHIKIADATGHYTTCERTIAKVGINMSSLTRLYKLGCSVEKGELTDLSEIYHKIRAVRPRSYDKNFLLIIESVAALCFAYCNGGDLKVCISAFFGGFVLMFFRFMLIKKGYFENFAFMISSFLGCLTTFLAGYLLAIDGKNITLALMATTLLLVPGFPYMNGFLDTFKGYMEMGLQRLMYSVLLTTAACIGLFGALCVIYV